MLSYHSIFARRSTCLHDCLFMLSAIMACPLSILTEQKHDIQFGTNVLGALTNLILPPFSPAWHTRIRTWYGNTSDQCYYVIHVGHYHLVTLLLPALARASELNSTTKSRVIFTSSSASYMSNGIEWDALSDNMALKEKGRKKVGPRGLYSMSKFVRDSF